MVKSFVVSSLILAYYDNAWVYDDPYMNVLSLSNHSVHLTWQHLLWSRKKLCHSSTWTDGDFGKVLCHWFYIVNTLVTYPETASSRRHKTAAQHKHLQYICPGDTN
jgi:hypothetical protein